MPRRHKSHCIRFCPVRACLNVLIESVHKICRQNLSKIKLCDWPNELDATSWQVLNTTESVGWTDSNYNRCPGLPASSLPVCPVYRCFFFVPPRHPGLPMVCRYTGVIHFFMLAEPLLLLHTPTHAATHNTTQHAGCCGQQPTLAYTPCHVRQENYANLVSALPPQNSPAAAHMEVACTAFAVILMTTRKSTASANHALQQRSLPAVPMTTRMWPSVKREGVFYNKAHRKNEKARPASGSLWGKSERFFSFWIRRCRG